MCNVRAAFLRYANHKINKISHKYISCVQASDTATNKEYDKNKIDIDFDFRQDSKCGDPDTDSRKLYEAQSPLYDTLKRHVDFF